MNKWTSWSLIEELRKGFLTDTQCFSCGCKSAWRFTTEKTLNGLILPLHLQGWDFCLLHHSEYLPTCLSVIPVRIWVWGSPPAAQGISHFFWGVSNNSLHKTNISQAWEQELHTPSLLVLAVIPAHSKSLQTTPKPTFSHKTPRLCKVKCQQFRLNSFQGCFGKLKIHKTNVNSTPVTNISGKINLKNCVKNEKYFNGWDRALSSDVGALSHKGDAKTITLYSPALTFLMQGHGEINSMSDTATNIFKLFLYKM